MDYATLIAPKTTPGSIADAINWALAPAAVIVKEAQDEIFTLMRVREMRHRVVLQVPAGRPSVPLPADYLDAMALYDPFGCEIERLEEDRLESARCYSVQSGGYLITSTGFAPNPGGFEEPQGGIGGFETVTPFQPGIPAFYAVFDQALQFNVAAIQALSVRLIYYGATYIGPAPTQQNPNATVNTNFLTNRYSQILRSATNKHAYLYRKEYDSANIWDALMTKQIGAANDADDLSYRTLR